MAARTTRWTRAAVIGAVALGATACIRWEAPVAHPVALLPGEQVARIVAGDVDGDGLDDALVVAGPASARRTLVLLADGEGGFQPGEALSGAEAVVVADLDGDGADDVIVKGPPPGGGLTDVTMTLLRGGAATDTRPAGLTASDATPLAPAASYQVGDFDGDGDLDLLRETWFMSYYMLHAQWLNDGTGTFTEVTTPGFPSGEISGPGNAGGVGALVYRRGGRDVVVRRNLGTWPGTGLPSSGLIRFGDVDGDGEDDAAVLSGDRISFLRGTASGFVPFPPYQEIIATGNPVTFELLDLDGDGATDLAYADAGGAQFLAGTADGGFPYAASGESPTRAAAFGDVDGDGLPEAITSTADRLGIQVHRNASADEG